MQKHSTIYVWLRKKAPTDALVLLNLAEICKKQKKLKEAKECYQKILELEHVDAHYLSEAKTALKALDQAKGTN